MVAAKVANLVARWVDSLESTMVALWDNWLVDLMVCPMAVKLAGMMALLLAGGWVMMTVEQSAAPKAGPTDLLRAAQLADL